MSGSLFGYSPQTEYRLPSLTFPEEIPVSLRRNTRKMLRKHELRYLWSFFRTSKRHSDISLPIYRTGVPEVRKWLWTVRNDSPLTGISTRVTSCCQSRLFCFSVLVFTERRGGVTRYRVLSLGGLSLVYDKDYRRNETCLCTNSVVTSTVIESSKETKHFTFFPTGISPSLLLLLDTESFVLGTLPTTGLPASIYGSVDDQGGGVPW